MIPVNSANLRSSTAHVQIEIECSFLQTLYFKLINIKHLRKSSTYAYAVDENQSSDIFTFPMLVDNHLAPC